MNSLSTLDIIGIAGTVLFAISEALASIPTIKANSVFQIIHSILAQRSWLEKLLSKK